MAFLAAFVFAVLSIDGERDVVSIPVRFAVALPVAAAVMWLVSKWWESRTWPEVPAFATRAAPTGGTRMLREDTNAALFSDRGGFLFAPRHFFTATGLPPVRLDADVLAEWAQRSASEPVAVAATDARTWWWLGTPSTGRTPATTRATSMR